MNKIKTTTLFVGFNVIKASILPILILWVSVGCNYQNRLMKLVDENANPGTVILYNNLRNMQGKALMFGHQATLEYGYSWTKKELGPGEIRSDVKDVTGSFPSVYGFSVNAVVNHDWTEVERRGAVEAQLAFDRGIRERGGLITYEWHMLHPDGNQSFYNTTPVVHRILPGGDLHDCFRLSLDYASEYFNRISDIPVLFRPWHEHNGDWFWWGRGSTSEEEFIKLWKFTVDYLKYEKQVHNLIYVYSPDRSRIDIDDFENGYFWGYPGDAYVDVFGLDNYWDLRHPANNTPVEEQRMHLRRSLEYLVKLADARSKVAALTETGYETIPDPNWWTDEILDAILYNEFTKRISWFLVWRNANREKENRDHYYAPYPEHPSASNFVEFKNHPFVLFEDELPDLYESF